MVWDLSLSLSLGLSSTPPPMGQGEEENTRGMGVFDLGELSLKGGMSIYIKCQRFFFFFDSICHTEKVTVLLQLQLFLPHLKSWC